MSQVHYFQLQLPGREVVSDGPGTGVPASHMGGQMELWAPGFAGTWEVNQQMEGVSLCLSAFQIYFRQKKKIDGVYICYEASLVCL